MNIAQIKVVLIDNHDSFTYNLVDELRVLGLELKVFRNTVPVDTVLNQLAEYQSQGPTLLLLSPGPGAPQDAGNMPAIIEAVKGQYPVLGICLGHQAIVEAYGGKVGRAEDVMHGKASLMSHECEGVFKALSNPLSIARYHSLVATRVPECLQVIASINNLPMAISHETDKMLGFQFHPESILTCDGSLLLYQAIQFLISDGAIATSEISMRTSASSMSKKD
jgi:anthranilate synthase component 2